MSASLVLVRPSTLVSAAQRRVAIAALVLIALLMTAAARHWVGHRGTAVAELRDPWLVLHLSCVVPALPLGAAVMLRRKGDRMHAMLGRVWAMLMLGAAASGLGLGQGWSPIHLLSVLVLVAVPHAVWMAIRGDIASHRRRMVILFASLVLAGFMTLLPVRLLGGWLFAGA